MSKGFWGRQGMLNRCLVLVLLWGVACTSWAQTWTVNFKDTEITEVIKFVADVTGKTVIIDAKVKGKINVISARALNADQLYDLFLAVLDVQGFTAVESGGVVRIVSSKDARASALPVVEAGSEGRANDARITAVIQLDNISAAKLIPVLRPLVPQEGHMAAYTPSNAIILSDTAANIERIREVVRQIDSTAVAETEVLPLRYASAEEVVRILLQLEQDSQESGEAANKRLALVADSRTNSILLSGDEFDRLRLRSLVARLDSPLQQSGNVRVVYLEYARAKDLAAVLSKVAQSVRRATTTATGSGTGGTAETTVEADEQTNALVITAEADVMQSLLAVVERLDIRRAQVLVEAAIVEISDTDGKDLGIEWLFADKDGGYGSFGGPGVNSSIAEAIGSAASFSDARNAVAGVISGVPGGLLGFGDIGSDYTFNAVIGALQNNQNANVLSTPSLLTLDNQEASIVVGQNVPFVTGSYSSTGAGSNPTNPFQTIEREDVGITLRVTPQVNEGDAVVLKISQEVSSLTGAASSVNASDVITNERKIETTILAQDGQIVVLGGLITDDVQDEQTKVPLLGDIPLIGRLFRYDSTRVSKTNLMVFIRPRIMRDAATLTGATADKYQIMRARQEALRDANDSLATEESLPLLPEWEAQLKEARVLLQQAQEAQRSE